MSRTSSQRRSKDDNSSQTTRSQQAQSYPHGQPQQHQQCRDSASVASSEASTRRSSTRSPEPTIEEIEEDSDNNERKDHARRFKLASAILCLCILSFVLQTELTKFVQTSMGYHKPYFILWISHSFWSIVLPFQFLYTTYIARTRPRSLGTLRDRTEYFANLIRQSTSNLYHNRNVAYNAVESDSPRASMSPQSPSSPSPTPSSNPSSLPSQASTMHSASVPHSSAFTAREKLQLNRYLFCMIFGMTTLFMVPSYLWYFCVALTSMANLTAIYNTACFFAYLFSILFLREKIVRNKVLAVMLSLVGVAIIGLTSRGAVDSGEGGEDAAKTAANKSGILGDVLSLLGAALYGFEEVMYKKYSSPKIHSVTFANTMTGCMGLVTLLMLWFPLPILHFAKHEIFELPTRNEFLVVLMIATLGLVYNGCFMIVMSLTSPVFAAVGVMATIPLVALTDWAVFGEKIGWGNIVGGISILVGLEVKAILYTTQQQSTQTSSQMPLQTSSSLDTSEKKYKTVLQPTQEPQNRNNMTPASGQARNNPFTISGTSTPSTQPPSASNTRSTIFKFGNSTSPSKPILVATKSRLSSSPKLSPYHEKTPSSTPLGPTGQSPAEDQSGNVSYNADDFPDDLFLDIDDEDQDLDIASTPSKSSSTLNNYSKAPEQVIMQEPYRPQELNRQNNVFGGSSKTDKQRHGVYSTDALTATKSPVASPSPSLALIVPSTLTGRLASANFDLDKQASPVLHGSPVVVDRSTGRATSMPAVDTKDSRSPWTEYKELSVNAGEGSSSRPTAHDTVVKGGNAAMSGFTRSRDLIERKAQSGAKRSISSSAIQHNSNKIGKRRIPGPAGNLPKLVM
ncbi:hypothetical protein BG004_002268 [Podila humilis]|nr:hypothetical protein BG004_002268 [Podila humilis]